MKNYLHKNLTLKNLFAIFIFVASLPFNADAAVLMGRVVGVLDGDTVDVLTNEKALLRVRISGIDAPEKKQPFGQVAKKMLSDLAFEKDVVVTWRKRNRYGRIIGKVEHRGDDIGLKMIQAGLGWHYKKYQSEQGKSDRKKYSDAEHDARSWRKGLWAEDDPIAPWDFRAILSRKNEDTKELTPASETE